MNFTDLPPELIEQIVILCDPLEVAKFAQTCSMFRAIVYLSEDSKLWRELYLAQPFDDPRTCVTQDGRPMPEPIQWKSDLQSIIRTRTVVTAENPHDVVRPGELLNVLETFLKLITYVPPWSPTLDISYNLVWAAAMLETGFLDWLEEKYGRNVEGVTSQERQLISRIHTYFGLTKSDLKARSRVLSRTYVYHLKNYKPECEYGPFLPTGEVNWEHLRELHHVISMHLVDLGEDEGFQFAFFPMSLPFTQHVIPTDMNLDEEEDWAGVAGHWLVSFCFCDHRDLLRFNEASATHLDTSLFEDPQFREEFRSLGATLSVKKIEPDPEHPTRPKIFFFGEMQEPSNSTMSGYVKMTKDNQIQWHFVSGDQGTGIWSSEGVQVGGIRSSYGVIGSWTTVFHDDDDPVGPFWLRKQLDHISQTPTFQ